MKFFHLADLHIGKRVHGFSLLEDQRHILQEVLKKVEQERPDAVVIAGDVYDAPVPSADAVNVLDAFLVRLKDMNTQVLMISGNHDSPDRLSFAARLLQHSGVHVSPAYCGQVAPIILDDAYGQVNFYLLPFIKPAHVRRWHEGEQVDTYTDALRVAIAALQADPTQRNVLVTHQFVTGAERSESEEVSVGGSDNVDAEVFAGFDYVALGHLHRPQRAGGAHMRYSGSPLKYSFSESSHEKALTVVEMNEKGEVTTYALPLKPLRDMREVRGAFEQVMNPKSLAGANTQDYVRVTLTDELEVPNALGKLRSIYPNLMALQYDNQRTRRTQALPSAPYTQQKTPLMLFEELYELQNNQPMTEEQSAFAQHLIAQLWEGEA